MNERILQLAKQATIRVNNPTVNSNGKVICDNWEEGVSLSKFAELLIRECARVAGQEQVYNERHEIPVNIEQSVLEHFGVSE